MAINIFLARLGMDIGKKEASFSRWRQKIAADSGKILPLFFGSIFASNLFVFFKLKEID
ncbi:hypothetical protein [Ectothiorhodospira magna]|uniref:hypothetical protein n=1 Tax=Ectothiorhodospira magna TaxID=867345 RepID=UPI0012DBE29C|nr:hypothetical protein [Ectothiorhodospira magna]